MKASLRRAIMTAAFGLAGLAGSTALYAQQAAKPAHHSKLKGALVGAAAGHMLGGHAKGGAVAGVLWQHHKNKAAAKSK